MYWVSLAQTKKAIPAKKNAGTAFPFKINLFEPSQESFRESVYLPY